MAVIGRGAAVANIFGVRLSGFLAWFIWLFIHLMYLVNFQSRILVFVQWGFQYLTFSRAQRLITVSPLGIERLLRREGFRAHRAAPPQIIDGHPIFACWIDVTPRCPPVARRETAH